MRVKNRPIPESHDELMYRYRVERPYKKVIMN